MTSPGLASTVAANAVFVVTLRTVLTRLDFASDVTVTVTGGA